MGLLERAEQLAILAGQLAASHDGGRVVLISGEAGAGKSALVQEFLAGEARRAPVLVGRCDDLFAPRPLGPLVDMARTNPGPMADALARGDQGAVFEAFLAELSGSRPVVVVIEDLQWADDATLDLLRFVGRRLASLRCLLVLTHRSHLPRDHPFRRVAGTLAGPHVARLELPPLSVDAVRSLVGARAVDPVALHDRTGGNPFFVVEVLAGDTAEVPPTVRDAVLARAQVVSRPARDALDAAAVLGRSVPAPLIVAVAGCSADAVDECVAAGLLVDAPAGQVQFRHDLCRHAIDDALPPLRRRELHTRALETLGEDADLIQRAHHAVGAGDPDAIVDHASRAAGACLALGAKLQAAMLYEQAMRHGDRLPYAARLALFERASATFGAVEWMERAIAAGERALEFVSAASDDAGAAYWESRLAAWYLWAGRADEADTVVHRAAQRLPTLPETPRLAETMERLAGYFMVMGDAETTVRLAERAQAIAERYGREDIAVAAMDNRGAMLAAAGRLDEGLAILRDALDRAKQAGVIEEIARVSANLSETLVNWGHPAQGLGVADTGLSVAEEHELRLRSNCLRSRRAGALSMLGRWDEATAALAIPLADPDTSAANRAGCLTQLGTIRARRGDPGAREALDEALTLALRTGQAQYVVPARCALAEALWLTGDLAGAAEQVNLALPLAGALEDPHRRDLARWAHRTGVSWQPDACSAPPISEILRHDAHAEAAFWDGRGCVYEAADALGESDDVGDLRDAYDRLLELGARPRAQMVARRLRERGARNLPRGPRQATKANAAGLTAREVAVAALLAEGLTNAEIAARLVVSVKTVDHHVSAVLAKLGVGSRRRVGEAARGMGVDLTGTVTGEHAARS